MMHFPSISRLSASISAIASFYSTTSGSGLSFILFNVHSTSSIYCPPATPSLIYLPALPSGLISDLVYYASVSRAEGPFGPLPTLCCYPSIQSCLRILLYMTDKYYISYYSIQDSYRTEEQIKEWQVVPLKNLLTPKCRKRACLHGISMEVFPNGSTILLLSTPAYSGSDLRRYSKFPVPLCYKTKA